MWKRLAIIILAASCFVIISSSSSLAAVYNCTSCADCSSKIISSSSGDIIQINQSISGNNPTNGCGCTCIDIDNDTVATKNITIDCLGNTITSNVNTAMFGQNSGTYNITIRNCVLTGSSVSAFEQLGGSRFNISHMTIYNSGAGFYAQSVSNSIVDSVSVSSGTWAPGWDVRLISDTNITMTNITSINGNLWGIQVDSSTNVSLTDFTISGTDCVGLSVTSGTTGSTFRNGRVSGTLFSCLYPLFWRGAVMFDGATNTTLDNVTIDSNSDYGLSMSKYYGPDNQYNIIKNSRITSNTVGINMSSGLNLYNTFYNNYVKNTLNFYSASSNNLNYWNTTKNCTGQTNILGGFCLAGNYWANSGHSEFSDLCTDSNYDGVCDSAYSFAANNTDYLPLTVLPTNCTSCADCTSKVAAAASYDIIRLIQDVNATGNCIDYGVKSYITFDCSGHSITGDGSGDEYGFYLTSSFPNAPNHNTIRNCVIKSFGSGGIRFYGGSSVSYNTVENVNSSYNSFGIYLYGDHNVFSNSSFSYNTNQGVIIDTADYNNFTNVTLRSNGAAALDFGFHSEYNTVKSCRLENNGGGISLGAVTTNYPRWNVFYDNYFNNSVNFNSNNNNNFNYLNTTKVAGVNIISGSYLGGNYWAYPNGTGYSQTCSNTDGDGICDSSYQAATNNTDYLPLTYNSGTVPTIVTQTLNNTYANNRTPSFSFYAVDNSSLFSCILMIDGSSYGTNSSVLNNTLTTIVASSQLSYAKHSWYVNCTNTFGNSNISETRQVVVYNASETLSDANVTVDTASNVSVLLPLTTPTAFVNYTSQFLNPSLLISFAVYNSSGINITYIANYPVIQFNATSADSPIYMNYSYLFVYKLTSGLNCPINYADNGYYCKKVDTFVDRNDYYYLFRINATDNFTKNVVIFFNTVGIYTDLANRSTNVTLQVDSIEAGTAVNVSGISILMTVYSNFSTSSLSYGVHTYEIFYSVPVTTPPGGGFQVTGGGGVTTCGDSRCDYPENAITCPQDCGNISFTTDTNVFRFDALPDSRITCLGIAEGCALVISNPTLKEISVIATIDKGTDESNNWGYFIGANNTHVTRYALTVPASSSTVLAIGTYVPADTAYGTYAYQIVLESGNQRLFIPYNINVVPSLSITALIFQALFASFFGIPAWLLTIGFIFVVVVILAVRANRSTGRR